VLHQVADLPLRIKVDAYGNVLITKGNAEKYPCVAAHLDEVHQPSVRNLQEKDGNIYALDENSEPVGIGADDKNGVWIVLQLLRQIETMKAVLFVREEKATFEGYRHGSDDCDLAFFTDVKFVLQCDRTGAGDLVTYCTKKEIRLCDDDFVPEWILQKYGYAPVEGGVTDVVHLKQRGLQIPCCNISCGFYNAHKPEEYTNVAELQNSLEFVKTLVSTL
jgi:putative aminopeptidase FrvX